MGYNAYQDDSVDNDSENDVEYNIGITDEEFQEDTKTIDHFYVDPDKMLAAYIEYKKDRQIALDNGAEYYNPTPYLTDCIIKISNHLSYRFNFINYSYRQDMVADGIESCLRGFHNYDPERSKYIFAYYTRGCFHAFVRRIIKEQKETEIKGKIIANLDIDSIVTQATESGEFDAEFIEYMKIAQDFKVRPEKVKPEKPLKVMNVGPQLIFDEE